jgi:acetyl esterase/lipase
MSQSMPVRSAFDRFCSSSTRLLAAAAVISGCIHLTLQIRADIAPVVVRVWPGRPPDETTEIGPERTRMSPSLDRKKVEVTEPTRMITDVTEPTITVCRPPEGKAAGTAILIFPGGGYWDLYWQLEGEEVAAWLNSQGIHALILKYRVPRRPDEPKGEPARRPLQDAQRALSLARSRAAEWGFDPHRIGVIGFSAGGHLAVASATQFDKRTYAPIDDIDKTDCRPDFAIPVYPGYLASKNADSLAPNIVVPTNASPMFLIHGGEDIITPPENSVLMYLAMRRAGVPAELHVYAGTAHDFGVRTTGAPYSAWKSACIAWLGAQRMLAPNPNQPPPGLDPPAPKR